MSSTYDYGFTPGSGANREDLGRRKKPSKRKEKREQYPEGDTLIPPARQKPKKGKIKYRPSSPNYA